MNLPEAFHDKQGAPGFTLVEVLLVIGLVLILGAWIFPVGLSSYQSQILSQTRDGVEDALRKAQNSSRSGKHDRPFGVMIAEDTYTIFEGEEYETRVVQEDEIFPIPDTVLFSGIDEIIFEKMSGNPDRTGTITVSTNSRASIIQILPGGTIE
jgi:prepilin-type N-terminal cleavage/methylation domain-containing protein